MSQWQEEKKCVLEAAQKMAVSGLVVGTSGNISLRLPYKRPLLAITPSSLPYDTLNADDIQVVDFYGRKVEGNLPPSIETMLHIGIYKARKDICAVIHTHSVYASAAAVAGLEIPPIMDDQVICLGGEIKLAVYAPGGSQELADAVVAALGDRNGVIMANHGAAGVGRTMRDAFTACEIIEKTARIYLLALSAGKVNSLTVDEIRAAKVNYAKVRLDNT
jgi:L-fuculose-phosphate aldolase